MIAFHQADGFRLGAAFERLEGAFQREILDQDHAVAVHEHLAMGVLDDARPGASRTDALDDPAVDVGQPEVAALVADGEAFMVDAAE